MFNQSNKFYINDNMRKKAILLFLVIVVLFFFLKKILFERRLKIEIDMYRNVKFEGDFLVITNVFENKKTSLEDTITMTTHGEYMFLENLLPLVLRWKAPISVSVYAPGDDFQSTIDHMVFLRFCFVNSFLIREFVQVHIYIDEFNIPSNFAEIFLKTKENKHPDCLKMGKSVYFNLSSVQGETNDFVTLDENVNYAMEQKSYRNKMKLFYPINFGRNLAIKEAPSEIIFPNDIELYPNENFVTNFIQMLKNSGNVFKARNVYTLPVFEISENINVKNREQLYELYKQKKIRPFHENICAACHQIPSLEKWFLNKDTDMKVFISMSRKKPWEPIFVTTKNVPLYFKFQSWEERSDKMTQVCMFMFYEYTVSIKKSII